MGEEYVFMNNETYEQLEIPVAQLEYEKNFLVEGMEVKINTFNSEILGVEVPEKVTLEVVECEPGVKGNTASMQLRVQQYQLDTLYKFHYSLKLEIN